MNEVELRKLDEEMVGAYTDHNVDLILSHCADDVLMHDYGAEPVQGKDACRDYLTQQFGAFSNEKATHIKRIIGDNEVFAEMSWSGTHTGDIPMPDGSTIPPTGKSFDARVAYYARVNDAGEVVEMRAYPDIAGVMGQLGLFG
jgi:predicted ester cyclase